MHGGSVEFGVGLHESHNYSETLVPSVSFSSPLVIARVLRQEYDAFVFDFTCMTPGFAVLLTTRWA